MIAAVTPHIPFALDPMWVSMTVLAVTYAFIIAGRHNRAVVALIGAVVVVIVGALDQDEAVKGIDWDTIGLVTGMMILVAISRRSGLFQYLAIWSAQRVKASPAGILLTLQIATALLSGVLNNVSTVLLIVPVTLAITEELEVSAFPFLFAEVFASNIGGTATLIGDPPNILIGTMAGLDFNSFLANVAPVAVLVMAVQALLVHLIWGRALRASPERRTLVMGMNAPGMISDWVLLRRSVLVLGAVLAAFVAAGPLRLHPATIAITGAAALMLLDNWQQRGAKQADNVHRTFADVEWTTIFFFIGLFVVVHAVEVSGLLGTHRRQAGRVDRRQHRRGRRADPVDVRGSIGVPRQHSVRRHHDPGDQRHGGRLWRAGRDRAAVVVPVARRLPRRQRHADRRRRESRGRRHRRAQRHPLRLHSVSGLRRADDAGLHRHLPSLRVAAVFLRTSNACTHKSRSMSASLRLCCKTRLLFAAGPDLSIGQLVAFYTESV